MPTHFPHRGAIKALGFALLATPLLSGCGQPQGGDSNAPASVNSQSGTLHNVKIKPNAYGATLIAIKARGYLTCGVHPGLVGFSYQDNRSEWKGFDVDFCRATAAAVFGQGDKVRFIPLETADRLTALQNGTVDVLWRSTSWTLLRDTADHLNFPGVNYYDGQGFLVRKSLRLNSATELNGARICVQSGSTTELNLAEYFRGKNLKYTPIIVPTEDQARANYANEACDAFTADISALAAARTTLNDPQNHVILPEVISKEPLGPVVREGDDQWSDIVHWTLNALILSEELGVNSKNIDEALKTSKNSEIRRLLGADGDYGKAMGLNAQWAYRAVKSVGNYGEIFDRNIGASSPLNLDRG